MAIYSDVTCESVLAAIRECDEKGRGQFLAEHGYGTAQYLLVFEDRAYDSKAILLVAYGYEHPEADPLPHDGFRGGRRTVVAHLQKLGFSVRVRGETGTLVPVQKQRTAGRVTKRPKKGSDGRAVRRKTPRKSPTWSEWCVLDDVSRRDDAVLDNSGVYRIRAVNADGNPVTQHRFLGVDPSGVVYIGQTERVLRRRLRNIRRGRRTGKTSHTLGRKLHVLDRLPAFQERFKDVWLECQYAESDNPPASEKNLIRAYVASYGEAPPLNGTFPDRGDTVAWGEHIE
jgi:hypothetical protein